MLKFIYYVVSRHPKFARHPNIALHIPLSITKNASHLNPVSLLNGDPGVQVEAAAALVAQLEPRAEGARRAAAAARRARRHAQRRRPAEALQLHADLHALLHVHLCTYIQRYFHKKCVLVPIFSSYINLLLTVKNSSQTKNIVRKKKEIVNNKIIVTY